MLVLIAILHLCGLFAFLIKRESVIYYYICWLVFAPYIVSFIDFTEGVDLVVRGQANYFMTMIYLLSCFKSRSLLVNNKTLVLLGGLLFFLLLCSAFNSVPTIKYIKWAISSLLPILFLTSILKTLHISEKRFSLFVLGMLILQIIMGLCQYYTSFLFVSPMFLLNASDNYLNSGLIMGTFHGSNSFATHIFVFYLYFIIRNYPKRFLAFIGHAILLVFVFYTVLISGIRTYLILLIFSLFALLFLKAKNKIVAIAIISFSIIVGSSYLIVSSYGGQYGAESAIDRQINGISSLRYGDTDNSTLSYSVYVLENYYSPLDLFGKGLLYTPKGYGKIILPEYGIPDADVSDATLAVYLVEFGPIFMILVLFYMYYLTTGMFRYKDLSTKRCQILMFFIFLIDTITDAGLFDNDVLLIMAIISYFQYITEKNVINKGKCEVYI